MRERESGGVDPCNHPYPRGYLYSLPHSPLSASRCMHQVTDKTSSFSIVVEVLTQGEGIGDITSMLKPQTQLLNRVLALQLEAFALLARVLETHDLRRIFVQWTCPNPCNHGPRTCLPCFAHARLIPGAGMKWYTFMTTSKVSKG